MKVQWDGRAKVVFLSVLLSLQGIAMGQEGMPRTGEFNIHSLPATHVKPLGAIPAADPGPLVYHGGSVMQWGAKTYAIFWIPARLQNGGATSMSSHYQTVLKNLLLDYGKHGIDNNNTQYYQSSGTGKSYIQNYGYLAGSYVDTDPYPASGCTDTATPGNCITDAQIQAEITRVIELNGWIANIDSIFMLFTSSGEGSCFDASGAQCSYTYYCAYHGDYSLSGKSVIYANMPYGNPNTCQVPGTPSPNGDMAADTVATAASHELTEAITDPELNAWYTAQGNEIGDLCAYNYGVNTWDTALANQMWNGRFYELQTEFDNHTGSCVQVGP
jgi:hypothetical protein